MPHRRGAGAPIAVADGSPAVHDPLHTLGVLNEIARIATEDLELRPMLQRITDALAQKFGWDHVSLVRTDIERHRFVCEALSGTAYSHIFVGYSRELGSGVVGEVAATGRPIIVDDTRLHQNYIDTLPGALSEACVPVHHRGRLVAVLNLESCRLATFAGALPLLETVAEQIAGAIASAGLFEEVRRHASEMELLSEVSRIALEAEDLDALLGHTVQYVRGRFGIAMAAVLLMEESGEGYALRASATLEGRTREPSGARAALGFGIVGRALRTAQPQLVLDVTSDPDYRPVLDGIVAELAVPICFRGRVLGAFNFESTDREAFSKQNLALLGLLANQVAGAIHLSALNARLAGMAQSLEDTNRQLSEANQALHNLSLIDPLTGIANRRRFEEDLELEWRRASRAREPLAVLLVDIDCFKLYNDTYGHPRGDACLRRVARTLRDCAQRAGDLVARYGGEEFGVILPGADSETAMRLAESLRRSIEDLNIRHRRSTTGPRLTISVGVASHLPQIGTTSDPAVADADQALYAAKAAGRNRIA